MRTNKIIGALLATALLSLAGTVQAEPTLYEQIGGEPGSDQDVRLARAGAKDLNAEAREVVVRSARGHHLHRATRKAERRREHGVAARQLDEVLEPRSEEVVRDLIEAHQTGRLRSIYATCSSRTGSTGSRKERPWYPRTVRCPGRMVAIFAASRSDGLGER